MEPFCFLNGDILPVSQAKVGVYDIGLLRGFGVYEALRTFRHKPFMLPDHLKRFHRSSEAMTLSIPETDERIAHMIDELVARNIPEGREAIIRFILTGGEAVGGIELSRGKSTFYILVEELPPLPETMFTQGCKVIVHEHLRFLPEFKTTNYITAVLLQEERKKAGALEILYTYQGMMLEPATSNMFVVQNGVIITPKKDILSGITRKAVLEVARTAFPLEERDVSMDELYAADEAFLTSSFKDVVPVVEVGGPSTRLGTGKKIGSGAPGPITKRVMELFHAFTGQL